MKGLMFVFIGLQLIVAPHVLADKGVGESAASALLIEVPGPPDLLSPADGCLDLTQPALFQWRAVDHALSYTLEVSALSNFNTLNENISLLSGTSHSLSTLTGGTLYWRMYAVNVAGNGSYSSVGSFTLAPEITLLGDGSAIGDGDDTPCSTDHTDFGSMRVTSGIITRTFTIQNDGAGDLTFSDITVGGDHALDFSVTGPTLFSLATGESVPFDITFDPSAGEARTATLSLTSNDSDESPYDFSITGTGLMPEMSVSGNGEPIEDGASSPLTLNNTDFGGVDFSSGTIVKSFTIHNKGEDILFLTGLPRVAVSGVHASEFTLSMSPDSSVNLSGSTAFELTFDPEGQGLRTATLSIANSDGDENPYNFSIQGAGLTRSTFINGANNALKFQQPQASFPQADYPFGQFCLSSNSAGAVLENVSIMLGGTCQTFDGYCPFKLYASNSNDFSTAVPIGGEPYYMMSKSLFIPPVTFPALSDPLPADVRYYWVTVDLAANSSGTLYCSIFSSLSLTVSHAVISSDSHYGQLNAGGEHSLPVVLSSFTVLPVSERFELKWTTESETDNQGFLLERAVGCVETLHATSLQWDVIASYETHPELCGQGNSSARYDYSFVDATVEPGQSYGYRLSDVSTSGEVHVYDIIFTALPELPKETVLEPPFPNPFNPETKIAYQLAESGPVEIVVYDLLGRRVHALVDEVQSAGLYTVYWQGNNRLGERVATGTYVIVLKTVRGIRTQKVVMLR